VGRGEDATAALHGLQGALTRTALPRSGVASCEPLAAAVSDTVSRRRVRSHLVVAQSSKIASFGTSRRR